ncbi:MAG: glycoside hydrolase family 16 protein [Capsulimonadaceae bacterium]|nr:glycoside hydrolase family 16 protein [Capsulimonadaceae bacterium]
MLYAPAHFAGRLDFPLLAVLSFAVMAACASPAHTQPVIVVDDIHAGAAVSDVAPILLPATSRPKAIPAGQPFKLTMNWNARPMDQEYTVFVHFMNPAGQMVFQGDHDPYPATSKWTGLVSYTQTIFVPATVPDGVYTIVAGLYRNTKAPPGWRRVPILPGKGVVPDEDDTYMCGQIVIDHNAPSAPLDSSRPKTLSLKGYHMTFDDEFNALDAATDGPGRRWYSRRPVGGNFGDARFMDETDGFPFSVKDGILTIEARKAADHWQSGLLATMDSHKNGFAQKYGYFEMRAKFPKGPGTWPAFWMLCADRIGNSSVTDVEIDVVEQYGHAPQNLYTTLHTWAPNKHTATGAAEYVADMAADFHNYGVMWDPTDIIWYFDGVEMFRRPTPPEATGPMYMLVNLALGGGWPIDKTPDPSDMQVKYVRAYARQ